MGKDTEDRPVETAESNAGKETTEQMRSESRTGMDELILQQRADMQYQKQEDRPPGLASSKLGKIELIDSSATEERSVEEIIRIDTDKIRDVLKGSEKHHDAQNKLTEIFQQQHEPPMEL